MTLPDPPLLLVDGAVASLGSAPEDEAAAPPGLAPGEPLDVAKKLSR